MLHAYARIVQREELEEYHRAFLIYTLNAPHVGEGSSLRPPVRPAILDWVL